MADPIEALIAAWEPVIKTAFLRSVHDIRDGVRLAELVRLLEAGDAEGALRAVGLEAARFRPFGSALEQAFEASGTDIAGVIDRTRRANLVRALFDIRDPRAEQWISTRTSTVVRDIIVGQEQVVRTTFSIGLQVGRSPQAVALDLVGRVSKATGRREGGALGLTPSQEEWARNYEAELKGPPDPGALNRKLRDRRFDKTVAKAIREGREIPAETRQAMVNAYRNRALRQRAETIAQVEAHEATQAAQGEAWEQAIARGAVSRDAVKRFWVTAQDDHVRPTHRAVPGMNKDGVGLDQPFMTPKGLAMHPGWSFDPGCRCRERIKVVATLRPMEFA